MVKSPREAAMGVATLSGLMLHLFDINMTPTIIIPKMTINKFVSLSRSILGFCKYYDVKVSREIRAGFSGLII